MQEGNTFGVLFWDTPYIVGRRLRANKSLLKNGSSNSKKLDKFETRRFGPFNAIKLAGQNVVELGLSVIRNSSGDP